MCCDPVFSMVTAPREAVELQGMVKLVSTLLGKYGELMTQIFQNSTSSLYSVFHLYSLKYMFPFPEGTYRVKYNQGCVYVYELCGKILEFRVRITNSGQIQLRMVAVEESEGNVTGTTEKDRTWQLTGYQERRLAHCPCVSCPSCGRGTGP